MIPFLLSGGKSGSFNKNVYQALSYWESIPFNKCEIQNSYTL